MTSTRERARLRPRVTVTRGGRRPRGGVSRILLPLRTAVVGGKRRSGEDLLNFGNDSGAYRPNQAPEPPPPRPTTNGGRSPVPAGWGNRPAAAGGSAVAGCAGISNGGASLPGRKSTAGRMQAAAAGRTNGGGSRGPTGAPVNNG
ncbi:hypothetical protein Esi_0196_0047 [Ectocarpus siliculosus]|uniref:Uncharacterized protein n=1 Tax=Ectocarpus siliculosus TaxID=2880 RepID=D8LHK1_ECTSI|nr:hypothetical protein Esi_0196_0047 [Ectocarpus siliculosus]|eukprot:CBN79283.1 hypothetical protein Esi_0196_0047 [Ectocarpus siliculosus]